MKETVTQVRSSIIRSVLDWGIISSAQLQNFRIPHLRGADKRCTFVEGVRLSPDTFSTEKTDDLYIGCCGIFPVLAERYQETSPLSGFTEKDDTDKQQVISALEERMASSFIIVIKNYDFDFMGHRKGNVGIAEFERVLVPLLVYENCREAFDELSRCPVVIVSEFVERDIKGTNFPKIRLKVPNYEDPLQRIVQEEKENLWVHGVRLPIEEDLADDSTLFLKAVSSETILPQGWRRI